jgi:hypothetical protein
MTRHLALLAPLAIAACAAGGTEFPPLGIPGQPGQPSAADTCGAAAYAAFLDQPRAALNGVSLPPGTRVILPGDAVTQDYVETRLNFEIDGNVEISRIYCG